MIIKDSNQFFTKINFATVLLENDPATWTDNEDCKIINNFKVVHDTVESSIKLIGENGKILTKDEEQNQYLVRIVKDYKSRSQF